MPPAMLFFLKIDLAIHGILLVHVNFRIAYPISEKKNVATEILIGISLNL